MGRGRGKAKKSSIMAREDGSGEEEKLPVKRRGRPTKAQKENNEEEEEAEKMDYENKDTKVESSLENGSKRKKQSLETEEESMEMVKDEENGDVLTKSVGFRHNGSRRKNKPRRAAEVGVSACQVCSWVALKS
ncbi:uncharacterized protein LOC111897881 [Lactuca sativa]|uniref:Uncharacterized protein n=1 Tax=Lactuca sativa TaxID=4236 RepID=A0A9R1XH26_LACSA|nr:uncharacterized protein LOC111897881 [Lactuca sativa]KAJ0207677.1 hypothetical protein LSAT_V11C500288560 [Lactuca sativa]